MKVTKKQNVIPAQSANFQLLALFQHLMLSSNPLGIKTVPARKSHNRCEPVSSFVERATNTALLEPPFDTLYGMILM